MNRKKIAATIVAAVAVVGVVAGCGSYSEANNYNLPDSVPNIATLHWTRLDSPKNYPTIMHTCYKGDGIYENQDASNTTFVVPADPACK